MPINHKPTYHNQTSFITNENLNLETTQLNINSKLDTLTDINNKLDTLNISLGTKLDTLISLQGGTTDPGTGGTTDPGTGVELRSIIPDQDTEGVAISIGGGLKTYTWAFTTTTETQYDLYAATNGITTMDEEKIFTMYFADDSSETTILDPTMFLSKNEGQINMTLQGSQYVINFTNEMLGTTPQADLTLLANTTYFFKISTIFNDDDTFSADVRFAITNIGTNNILQLNYISVV